MIGYPYTKYTVAMMDVDMGPRSLSRARAADALGVSRRPARISARLVVRDRPDYVAEHPTCGVARNGPSSAKTLTARACHRRH